MGGGEKRAKKRPNKKFHTEQGGRKPVEDFENTHTNVYFKKKKKFLNLYPRGHMSQMWDYNNYPIFTVTLSKTGLPMYCTCTVHTSIHHFNLHYSYNFPPKNNIFFVSILRERAKKNPNDPAVQAT